MFIEEGEHQENLGYGIGRLVPPPEVYHPGALTLLIDDFCVRSENLWASIGTQLIETIKPFAKAKSVAQILIVCVAHNHPKRQCLMNQSLFIAAEWFVGDIV